MADTKFSQFSSAITLTGSEKIVGLQSGDNTQMVLSTVVLPYINANTQLPSTAKITGLDTQLAAKLALAGGTLTGAVIAAADPVVALGLATKQYVDNSSAALDLQDIYNNSSAPQHINFASGQGLIFNDSSATNRFIFTETYATFLNAFTVSKTGTEGLSVLQTSDNDSTMLEVLSITRGSKPEPAMTQSQRGDIPTASIVDYTKIYNTDTNTFDYHDTTQWQQQLTVQNVLEGTNITVDKITYPGKIVISASGGGTSVDAVQGSFNCFPNQNSAVTTPTTGPFIPVAIDPAIFNPVHTDGTNVVIMTILGIDTPVIQNIDSGGARWCKVTFDLTVASASLSGQSYTFRITTNTGATDFIQGITILDINTRQPVSVSGMVYLSTNDYVYLTVISSISLADFSAQRFDGILVDTTVASIPDAVVTSGSYSNPSWITSLANSKITGKTFQSIYDAEGGFISYITLADDEDAGFVIRRDDGGYACYVSPAGVFVNSPSGISQQTLSGEFFGVEINTTDPVSTYLELRSTLRGAVAYNAMTSAESALITMTSAPLGWGIFNTDQKTLNLWDGTTKNPVAIVGGATVSGHLSQFSNTTGKLADSGIVAADVVITLSSPQFTQELLGPGQSMAMLGKLNITGTDTSTSGPIQLFYTATDLYPLLQILPYSHGNISLVFDAYYNGTNWISSKLSSNYLLTKYNDDKFSLQYASGFAAGATITWATGWSMDTSGHFNLPGLTASNMVITDEYKNLGSAPLPLGFNASAVISSSTQVMAFQTIYVNTYAAGQMAATLPAATGSRKSILLIGDSTASTAGWKVTANGSDVIQVGSSVSAAGGNVASTVLSATDTATFLDSAAGKWIVYDFLGTNLVVT